MLTATCPIHNEPMQEQDGLYGPYFSHKTNEGYCNGKRIKPYTNRTQNINQPQRPQQQYNPPPMSKTINGRDEEQIKGQIRTWLVSSLIQQRGLKPLTSTDVGILNNHVNYIMSGKQVGINIEEELDNIYNN